MKDNIRDMKIQTIINDLNNGVIYGNHNVTFIYSNGEMLMCEYTKDCKYTKFTDIIKFAKRIIKFCKIGY